MHIDPSALEFEWDSGNSGKNRKHEVERSESEEIFFDDDKVTLADALHSGSEERFIIIGKTKMGRLLFVVYTKRRGKIRVISARDLNKKERHLYYEKEA